MDTCTIYIMSDGTGETASTMVRAGLVQYQNPNIQIIRCKNVRSKQQIISLLETPPKSKIIVVYTFVSRNMRSNIAELCQNKDIPSIDLLGPLLNELDQQLGSGVKGPGLLRQVDDRYFRRIEAIEYTVKHDDGKSTLDLNTADIVLVGLSRTSKTPLSIFLSHKGFKVANVPLVLGVPLPKDLFEIDQRKVVALTINPDNLQRIRKRRLEKFRQDPGGDYASHRQIEKEFEYAEGLFKKNRRWPIIDVTDRALEETATEIIRIVASRMNLSYQNLL